MGKTCKYIFYTRDETNSYYVYWTAKLAITYDLHNCALHRTSEDCKFVRSGSRETEGQTMRARNAFEPDRYLLQCGKYLKNIATFHENSYNRSSTVTRIFDSAYIYSTSSDLLPLIVMNMNSVSKTIGVPWSVELKREAQRRLWRRRRRRRCCWAPRALADNKISLS